MTRCVALTGGPGAGKTTLLAALAAMGYTTVGESARAVIAERLARGESPRPEPLLFAREVLQRDVEKHRAHAEARDWVFFDRSVVDALGLLHEAAPLAVDELRSRLAASPLHRIVFVLPPWQAIYVNDAERDQSYPQSVAVHASLVRWYRSCGYTLHEVPRLPVQQRAMHVLQVLAGRAAPPDAPITPDAA